MKKVFAVVGAVLLVISIYLSYEYYLFPVKYYICNKDYKNCFIHSKFKNQEDCEIVVERLKWLCDKSDKSNIKCKEEKSNISESYCSK